MNIRIRSIEKLKGAYGETRFPTPNKAIILISRRLNRRLASYGATLLHELLHAWVHVLGQKGFTLDDEAEHDFIYAAERAVLIEFRKIKRGRK